MNGRRCLQIDAESHDTQSSVIQRRSQPARHYTNQTDDTAEKCWKYTNDETLKDTYQRTRNEGVAREASENQMPPLILQDACHQMSQP